MNYTTHGLITDRRRFNGGYSQNSYLARQYHLIIKVAILACSIFAFSLYGAPAEAYVITDTGTGCDNSLSPSASWDPSTKTCTVNSVSTSPGAGIAVKLDVRFGVTLVVNNTLSNAGATNNFGTITTTNLINSGTVNNTGSLTCSGTCDNSATIVVSPSGSSVAEYTMAGTMENSATGSITVQSGGKMLIDGGTLNNTGAITLEGASELTNEGTLNNGLIPVGSENCSIGTISLSVNSKLMNESGNSLVNRCSTITISGSELLNDGSIENLQDSTISIASASLFNNKANSSLLNDNSNISNSAVFLNGFGASVTLTNNAVMANTGPLLLNFGLVSIGSGSQYINGSVPGSSSTGLTFNRCTGVIEIVPVAELINRNVIVNASGTLPAAGQINGAPGSSIVDLPFCF